MGQALRGVPEGPGVADGDEPGGRPSIGAWLARQRLLRRITLDELEAATRIPRRSLERLEAGAFDRDRDAFARSFVRTVATAIGLDANDAVTRMLAEAEPAVGGRGARRLRVGRVAVLVGAVVLVVSAAAAWRAGVPALAELSPWGARERPIVHRRDAVRALAEEVRLQRLLAPSVAVPPARRAAPPDAAAPPAP